MGLNDHDAGTPPTEKTKLCSQTQKSTRVGNEQRAQQESCPPGCSPFDNQSYSKSSPSRNISITESNETQKDGQTETSDTKADESDNKNPSLWSSSKSQLLVLAALCVGQILCYMCTSILAPFFPGEASRKGMSPAVTGWVIGIFSLVMIFFAPVVGKLIPVVGSRFFLLSGMFFAGGCTILFGNLNKIPVTQENNMTFTVFCFVLRIFLALGDAAATTSIYAIAAKTFPDNISTVMGLLETFVGLGLILGPALGGPLYEAGGFLAPFATVGTAMILSVVLFYFIIPEDNDEDGETEQASIIAFLKIPVVDMILVTVMVSAILEVGLDPILQLHLMQFNLSPSECGLVFMLLAGTYAILAPISGRVADSVENSTPLMIIGFGILTVAFLLLGPSDLIGLGSYKALWLNLVSIALVGAGISLTVVPTFDKITKAAEKAGIPETTATQGIISGIWTSVYAFGELVGPVYCGAAFGAIGFSWTMTIIAVVIFLMFLLMIFTYLYEKDVCCGQKTEYKKERLL